MRKLQTNDLRGTVMSRLRRVNYMCSRTVSDPANRLLKRTDSEGSSSVAEKKSSAVPLISKRSHIGNLRRIRKQGKGRSPKRKGNRRCPFLFAPAAGAAVSRAPQSATPSLNLSGKHSARIGRTRLRSSCTPVSRCRKKTAARIGRSAYALRVPRKIRAEWINQTHLIKAYPKKTALSTQ